jgi:thiol-disulfide isomerase/thioredoxin
VIAALLVLAAGAAAPPLPTLTDADAFGAQLQALQADGKPVVLHFFATWCGPCVKEAPLLKRAFKEATERGATVALFSLDETKDQPKVRRFLTRVGAYPTWLLTAADPEPIAALLDPVWSGGLPATFVFQRGKKLKTFLGPLKRSKALIEALP